MYYSFSPFRDEMFSSGERAPAFGLLYSSWMLHIADTIIIYMIFLIIFIMNVVIMNLATQSTNLACIHGVFQPVRHTLHCRKFAGLESIGEHH